MVRTLKWPTKDSSTMSARHAIGVETAGSQRPRASQRLYFRVSRPRARPGVIWSHRPVCLFTFYHWYQGGCPIKEWLFHVDSEWNWLYQGYICHDVFIVLRPGFRCMLEATYLLPCLQPCLQGFLLAIIEALTYFLQRVLIRLHDQFLQRLPRISSWLRPTSSLKCSLILNVYKLPSRQITVWLH
jgi:hypothetical protein